MNPNLFEIDQNAILIAYNNFNKTEETANHDIEQIQEWMKNQSHLPEIMDVEKIRNFLFLNKFNLKKTQKKIDMYYTVRGLFPEFFEESNPKSTQMQEFMKAVYLCVLPKAIQGMHRVIFIKVNPANTFGPKELVAQSTNITEVRLYEDYIIAGEILIFDMMNITLSDVKKLTPSLIAKILVIFEVKCCNDYEVLKEILPIDQLPKDYGGDGPTLHELNEMMKSKLLHYQERFDKLDELRVNENLRAEKLNKDEIFGFFGHFVKLNLD